MNYSGVDKIMCFNYFLLGSENILSARNPVQKNEELYLSNSFFNRIDRSLSFRNFEFKIDFRKKFLLILKILEKSKRLSIKIVI